MKTWILAATLLAGVTLAAQTPDPQPMTAGKPRAERPMKERPSAQQRASIHTKELTLALDLTDKQAKDAEPLLLAAELKKDEFIKKREENRAKGIKPTAEERGQMRAALLDEKIKLKRDLKKILTADQYKKYEEKLEAKSVRKDKPQPGRFVRKQK